MIASLSQGHGVEALIAALSGVVLVIGVAGDLLPGWPA